MGSQTSRRPSSRGLRVLTVFHSGDLSGPSKTLEPRLALLSESAAVSVVFPWDGHAAQRYRTRFPVRVADYRPSTVPELHWRTAVEPFRLVAEVARLRHEFRVFDPDLALIVSAYLPAALVAAELEGVPAVVYAAERHAAAFDRGFLRRLASATLMKYTSRAATRIIANSDAVAARFAGGHARTVVVPPGFHDVQAGPLPLEGTRPRLAVIGAFSNGRGQDVALRAFCRIRDVVPTATLYFAGEAHPRPRDRAFLASVAHLREEMGLAESVVFLGAVENIDSFLRAVDVVLAPTRVLEGFGRVPFEALLASVPVVATPVGAASEVLPNNPAIAFVSPDDPDKLAEAALRLLFEPPAASDYRAAATLIRREYPLRNTAQEFVGHLLNTVREHRRE